jgi:hypothetical protein
MTRRSLPALVLPAVVLVAGCDDRPGDDGSRAMPDTLVHPGMDVPGAPGSITTGVDGLPEPRLRQDTAREPGDTTHFGSL